MARKYVWKRKDGFSQPIGLAKLMVVAGARVVADAKPFILTQDGEPISGKLNRVDMLSRFKTAISRREIGSVYRIKNRRGRVVFTARAVVIEERIPVSNSTNGNDKADRFYNWTLANFRGYSPRYAGAYVCKTIAGSNNLSQHSYGNAIDFFFDTIAHQEAVAEAARREAGALQIERLISVRRQSYRGGPWYPYGGDPHYHLHADFTPRQYGSCGVRG